MAARAAAAAGGAGGGGGGGGRGGRAAAGGAGFKRPRVNPGDIGNKMKRQEVVSKLKAEARREKKERRRVRDAVATELGAAAPPKAIPDTMERTREVDDTVVLPGDAEVVGDEADDEFADLFAGDVVPRIMITTAPSPSGKIYRLIAEFMAILPNTSFYKRRKFPLKKICTWATDMGFTHLLVLGEKSKRANSLHIVNLPYGPTAAFRLSSSRLASQIPGHGTMTSHNPEVILTNFVTRLGRRVGRFLGSMYPRNADFTGRRVCTFHNQRDYIFFRQHRYVFTEDGKRVRLVELGPRFTLKLKWILAGTFDTKYGEYEWFHKRHEMETSRRRFML